MRHAKRIFDQSRSADIAFTCFVHATQFAGQTLFQLLGKDDWQWLRDEAAARMRHELPSVVSAVYALTEESLQLEATMVEEMGKLSSAEFERVLHPVFEEDEWTLILIGTALGGIAGAAQARF